MSVIAAKPKLPIAKKLNTSLKIPSEGSPLQVARNSLQELVAEIFYIYPALYDMCAQHDHVLKKFISQAICNRLKKIIETNIDKCESEFLLTKVYRKQFPHTTDFELIQKCVLEVETELMLPHKGVLEAELFVSDDNFTGSEDWDSQHKALLDSCDLYCKNITDKLNEHITGLDTEPNESDTVEETAQKKVRTELKKVNKYMSLIVKQVIKTHVQKKPKNKTLTKFVKMKLFGDPYMPSLPLMATFLGKIRTSQMYRSRRLFNQIVCSVYDKHYKLLMSMDGTTFGGAKIYIRRTTNEAKFVVPSIINKQLKAFLKPPENDAMLVDDEEKEVENDESINENDESINENV